MSAPHRHWPILDTVGHWYRNWSAAREGAFEFQCVGTAEVERIAQDLGPSSSELRTIVSHPDERDLFGEKFGGPAP